MATAKKPPSRKQLAARKKFAAMSRRRAKEARAVKRAAGIKTKRPAAKRPAAKRPAAKRPAAKRPATKRRNSEERDSAHPIAVRRYFRSGGAGYMSAWHRAEKHGQQRLFKMNPSKRATRRNPAKGTSTHRYGEYGGHVVYAETSDYTGELVRYTVDKGSKSFYTLKEATDYIDRQQNPKRKTITGQSRKSQNGLFGSAARSALSRRLSAPIRFRRKRNSAPTGIEQMHKTFLGRPTDPAQEYEVIAPAGTPRDVAALGELTCLVTNTETFEFAKGEAILAANARGDLFILGDVHVESKADFGPVDEIPYLARKDHLQENPRKRYGQRVGHVKGQVGKRRNSGLTEYYHYFGEEGGKPPKLVTDADGMFHLQGGTYTIEAAGITD